MGYLITWTNLYTEKTESQRVTETSTLHAMLKVLRAKEAQHLIGTIEYTKG